MRATRLLLGSLLVTTLSTGGAAVAATGHHHAPPKPDLVVKSVSTSVGGGQFHVQATVTDKGPADVKATKASVTLSANKTVGRGDVALGSLTVPKVKAGKSVKPSSDLDLPATVAPGHYYVVVCADSRDKVAESKEKDNCRATSDPITVSGPGAVSATAGIGGTVAVTAISGGSCVGTACTFTAAGGSVTFTPSANSGFRFSGWTGATCSAYAAGAGGAITFTNPSGAHDCAASFARQVTITWNVVGGLSSGVVKGTVTAGTGTCNPNGVETTSGSCTVDAGAATVVLVARTIGAPDYFWGDWSGVGGPCDGTESGSSDAGSTMTITNAIADQSCQAFFDLNP